MYSFPDKYVTCEIHMYTILHQSTSKAHHLEISIHV
jgi:hypothetical protein